MNRRLAIVGTSHTAALKLGWEEDRFRHPGTEIDFFVAPNSVFRRLEIGPDLALGALRAERYDPATLNLLRELNGCTSIPLGEFDAVIYAGHNIGEFHHLCLLTRYNVDGLADMAGRPSMSQAAYRAFRAAVIEKALPGPRWRGWPHPPLFLAPLPRIAEGCPADVNPNFAPWAEFQASPAATTSLLDSFHDEMEAALKPLGISLLRPPPDVLAPSGLTRVEFTRGSVGLRSETHDAAKDFSHMNSAYGAAFLGTALEVIDAELNARAA